MPMWTDMPPHIRGQTICKYSSICMLMCSSTCAIGQSFQMGVLSAETASGIPPTCRVMKPLGPQDRGPAHLNFARITLI